MCVRTLSKGQAALSALQERNLPGALSLIQLDQTSSESITAAVAAVSKDHSHIDVLINNAGIISSAASPATRYQETLTTNAIGPALVTAAFSALLLKAPDPRLIYISSSLGSISQRLAPHLATSSGPYAVLTPEYRVSKAALNMLAACHVMELGPRGVKVWAVCPGYVVTNLGGGDREAKERTGATSASGSAELVKSVVEGGRDGDVGRFVHKDGVYDW